MLNLAPSFWKGRFAWRIEEARRQSQDTPTLSWFGVVGGRFALDIRMSAESGGGGKQ